MTLRLFDPISVGRSAGRADPLTKPNSPPPISREIWDLKYHLKSTSGGKANSSLDGVSFWRVARAAATAEKGGKKAREKWAKRFRGAMSDLGFLPAGRILAGAGTGRSVTLFNCFVLGTIDDDLSAIFANVKDAALTMQQGGGIGHDFSTLRPKGAPVASIGADASGPASFMEVWDAMCRTIMSAGSRRGAMMGTLRCDQPDIEAFIEAGIGSLGGCETSICRCSSPTTSSPPCGPALRGT